MKEKLEVAKSEDCTALQVEEEGKGTSSAPLQVHQGRGNPLNIVSLHCLTLLYYYLLIPPALLITVLFHVCPRGLVSFRVEEGGH